MKRGRALINDSVYPVFVTTTIVQWIPVFSDKSIAVEVLNLLETERIELGITIFAYVLMPSHFHAILKSIQKGDISVFMRRWKAKSARIILAHCLNNHKNWIVRFADNVRDYKITPRQNHQVWMSRFDDFLMRNEKELIIKLNYIHSNPIKQNLVENMVDYRYSSYLDYENGKNGFVKITHVRSG